MFTYLQESFRRKKARRFTGEYPAKVDVFDLPQFGRIEFANWTNPLVSPISIRQETIDFFSRFISPGDFVIDIGANIGDTTVPMALAAGQSGLTLGFDPNPYVFKLLVQNARLNVDKTNIVPLPYAVSSQDEELFFVSSEASFANGGVSRSKTARHGRFVHPEMVHAINLHQLLERDHGEWLPKLTFIKVDAEGHDAVILESIASLIDAYRPTVVAEIFGKDTDENKAALYRTLDRDGYDLCCFRLSDVPGPVTPVHSVADVTRWKTTMDIYAVPREA